MPSPPKSSPVALRVELLGIEPLIWRRIVVSNQWTFNALHNYLQWVMGWQESHAHEFRVADSYIAPLWWIEEAGMDSDVENYRDERRTSIASVVRELGSPAQFEYHYDMGDGWVHRITIESVPLEWEGYDLRTPLCSAGENACPPEDVGGPHGYRRFLDCLADSNHPEHADMARWIGGFFDPRGFDLNRLNRDWRPGRRGVR